MLLSHHVLLIKFEYNVSDQGHSLDLKTRIFIRNSMEAGIDFQVVMSCWDNEAGVTAIPHLSF
jgi:uncharacterized protein YccT (UPF0319 family)